MVEVDVPEGAIVVREGERGDAFYVILDGEAAVMNSTARGGSRKVAKLGPGSWFGELAVLDPAPRNATVVAATPMVVGVIGTRVFRAVLRDVPALTEKLLAGMARRLREADRVLSGDVGAAPTAAKRKSAVSRSRSAETRTTAAARGRQAHRPGRAARSSNRRAR